VSAYDHRQRRRRSRRPGGSATPDDQLPAGQGWQQLQRRTGNRAVGELLRRGGAEGRDAHHPASLLARLGKGRPLEGETRQRLEHATGRDLSEVRLHTDGEDAGLAQELGSRAFTVGDHVTFAPGEFRPGTPVGDAVLAHELAHVEQQRGGGPATSGESTAEHDADHAAKGTLAGLWAHGTELASSLAATARPRLRTGLALHRCIGGSGIEKQQPPSYLGPHSLEALEDIRQLERNHDLASGLIVFGTAVGTASPEGIAGEAVGVGVTGESTFLQGMPNAVVDIYIIKGYRILQRIDFLRLDHGNELNAQERRFWDRAYDRVSELQAAASSKRRGR
jgi:hypothetical protein